MTQKLSNVTFENIADDEWGITFHLGDSAKETIWVYKGMTARKMVQQILSTVKSLVDIYMSGD